MKGSHLIHSHTPQALQQKGVLLTSDVTHEDGTRYVYLVNRGYLDQSVGEFVTFDEQELSPLLEATLGCEVERLRPLAAGGFSMEGGQREYVATMREAVAA